MTVRDARMVDQVQAELGSKMPTMSPDRWEELREDIARFARERVRQANDHAQKVVFEAHFAAVQATERRFV